MKVYITFYEDDYENNIDKIFLNEKDCDDYVKCSRGCYAKEYEVIE